MLLKKIEVVGKPTFYRSRSRSKTDRLRNTGYGVKHVLWIAVQRRERLNIYNLETQLPSSWYGTEKEQSNI